MNQRRHDPERAIDLDLIRCTENAALAAWKWFGKGDKNRADAAAADALRGKRLPGRSSWSHELNEHNSDDDAGDAGDLPGRDAVSQHHQAEEHHRGLARPNHDGHGVVGADALVHDEPGDEVDALDLRELGEGAGELDHVLRLTAGVGVATQLEIPAAYQAVDTDQDQMQAVVAGHPIPPRRAYLFGRIALPPGG